MSKQIKISEDHLRGAMFKNKRKKKKTQPDMTGHLVFDRNELIKLIKKTKDTELKFWISGWHGNSKAGQYFMSLRANVNEESEIPEDEIEEEEEEIEEPKKKKSSKQNPKAKSKKIIEEEEEEEEDDPFLD